MYGYYLDWRTTLLGCASQMLGGCQPAWLDLRDDGPAMDSKWKKYFAMGHMTVTRKKKVDDWSKVIIFKSIFLFKNILN
jgi:hypothetical protein